MQMLKLFSDLHGESHFGELLIPMTLKTTPRLRIPFEGLIIRLMNAGEDNDVTNSR